MLKSKRAKELIPKTAKQCDVSEELATDVVNFYYMKLRKKMEALEDYRIGVPILGTFAVSKPKLKKSIARLTTIQEVKTQVNFDKIKRYKLSEGQLELQQTLLDKIEKDEQERKQLKDNLEKSSSNFRRNKE